MKKLRKILRVSWTAKKTIEWVLNEVGVKRELLDTVKARKLAHYGYTMRKQRSYLKKEITPSARRRERPRTASMDNLKTWTGLSVEESIRMTEDNDKWRMYVNGVAWPTLGSRTAKRTGTEHELTGHVIRRMRIGRVRIFNGNVINNNSRTDRRRVL